jgi:hypothetical protein
MVLDARTRSSIYEKLTPILGEHDANALMTQFPSIEADELVTKQFLRAELAELRAELRGEIAGLGTELRGEIAGLGTELRGEIAGLRTELRAEIAGLRTEVVDRFHQQTVWFGGALTAATALLAAIGLFG